MKNWALKNLHKALKNLAKTVLMERRPFIIGITGSVGKTSTKEAVNAVLKEEYGDEVRTSSGNLNTEIGLPLTILGYEKLPNKFLWPLFLFLAWIKTFQSSYPKYLVLEMGVDKPGDMEYFMEFVEPSISIVTALTPAHMANFTSLEKMQQEKLKIFDNQNSLNIKIYNGDDEYFKQNKVANGLMYSISDRDSDCFTTNINITKNGNKYFVFCGPDKLSIHNKLLGKPMISSQLAAIGVGKYLKIENKKIEKAINSLSPVNGRMKILSGKNGMTILDDTYNSSPAAVKAALDTVFEIKYEGRKVAILGNMNELGDLEKESHIEIAKYAKNKVDLCVFVGQNADIMLKSHGEENALAYKDRDSLISDIDRVVESGDLVFVKASQNNNYFEEVVKQLLYASIDPEKNLVRQDNFWLSKKKIQK